MKRKLISMVLPCLLIMALMMSPLFVDNQRAMAKAKSYVTTAENVEALSGGYNSVKLRWDNLEGTREYAVYRSKQVDGIYERIGKLPSTACSYTDKGLATGTTYFYKVARRVGSAKVSKNLHLVDIIQATPELASPKVVGKATSRAKVRLCWKKISGAKKYVVYKYSKKEKKYWVAKTVTDKNRYFEDKKRKPGTSYKYKVRAVRNAHKSKDRSLWVRTPNRLTQSTPGFRYTSAGKVIAKAESKLGAPYVWGANGPFAFDCSGFTCWTMQKAKMDDKSLAAGIKIPRYSSRDLYKNYSKKYGLGRDLKIAQPGDIIIISKNGSPKNIFHVGIYYDKGNYIHANGEEVAIGKITPKMVVEIIRLPGLDF